MTAESAEEEPSVKMLKCNHCPKEFKYNSERNRHELSHSPRFECEVCCKKFSFVSALRRHQKQHERTGSVKCEECNRKFRDEVLLKRHMKYAHKGTFTCTKCSTPFSSDQALRTHMKTHKPASERRFKCSFEGCRKSFNFSHHLKHHELTHTNAKQHYCSVCGKGFIQSHHLKTHLKTHDPSEWLYCEATGCKKKFSTEYARKRHMATHKIKPDSGISSDSNSCDASISSKEYVEDTMLCASCGEYVPQSDYSKHSTKCGDVTENSDDTKFWTISLLKQENIFEHEHTPPDTPRRMFAMDVGDCKSALGGCIMGINNCVCAEMSKPNDENYDFAPIEDFDDNATVENNTNGDFNENYSENTFDYNENKEIKRTDLIGESIDANHNLGTYTSNVNANMCGNCDCASSCNSREPSNCNYDTKKDIVPTVEYRDDGVVTIKDTCDLDLSIKVEQNIEHSSQFIPFSTCRDVIGNCIAGGSEGCLCARMMMDEQQAMAQEIDDITPKPKTENSIML